MRKYDMFSNTILLNMLTDTTPRTIFPDRKIGRLSDGYEASFLALECNPLKKFDCVKNIGLDIKQGISSHK